MAIFNTTRMTPQLGAAKPGDTSELYRRYPWMRPAEPAAPVTAPPPITLASGATVPIGTPEPPDARRAAFQASAAAKSAAMRQRKKAASGSRPSALPASAPARLQPRRLVGY